MTVPCFLLFRSGEDGSSAFPLARALGFLMLLCYPFLGIVLLFRWIWEVLGCVLQEAQSTEATLSSTYQLLTGMLTMAFQNHKKVITATANLQEDTCRLDRSRVQLKLVGRAFRNQFRLVAELPSLSSISLKALAVPRV